MNAIPVRADRSSSWNVAVDLREVIYALADTLDLVGIEDGAHGKRVGIMAASCGQALGLGTGEKSFLFDLGMLHDIGVSSTDTHHHLVSEFDWEGSHEHCEVGTDLLRGYEPLAPLAEPIYYHHTRWKHLSRHPAVDPAVAEHANLVYLVDRVDALAAPYYAGGELLMHTDAIRQKITDCAEPYFSPKLVDAFLAASETEAFWLQLEPRGIHAEMKAMLALDREYTASTPEVKQLARIFSRIVDAKSSFTAEHSLGVACLSRHLAERLGVTPENCDKVEIAGLLHDLGKLRVPDAILNKPGSLDECERKVITTHSYETYRILRHITGFEEIALWAACHHEEPDGSGYPFRLSGAKLPLEARILRVADIFQAMVQDRPYRAGLPVEEVLGFLGEMVSYGRIDSDIVAAVASDTAGAVAAALPSANRLPV